MVTFYSDASGISVILNIFCTRDLGYVFMPRWVLPPPFLDSVNLKGKLETFPAVPGMRRYLLAVLATVNAFGNNRIWFLLCFLSTLHGLTAQSSLKACTFPAALLKRKGCLAPAEHL